MLVRVLSATSKCLVNSSKLAPSACFKNGKFINPLIYAFAIMCGFPKFSYRVFLAVLYPSLAGRFTQLSMASRALPLQCCIKSCRRVQCIKMHVLDFWHRNHLSQCSYHFFPSIYLLRVGLFHSFPW